MTHCISKIVCVALIGTAALPTRSAGPIVLAESLKSGDTVVGAMRVGQRTVVLPSGNWKLVSKNQRNPSIDGSRQLPSLITLFFQEQKNGRLERILEVAATEYSGRVQWRDEPCKEKGDSYYTDIRENTTYSHFCFRVGFLSGMVDNARGEAFQEWAKEIKSQSVGYSSEMPFVMAIRYTKHNYLRMSIAFNPALAKLPATAATTRQASSWSSDNVQQHPSNTAFYEALRAWAPKFADVVRRANDGDDGVSDADYSEPKFLIPQ